jgi:hypothetical protein
LIAALFYGAYMMPKTVRYHFDMSRFVVAGDRFVDSNAAPPPLYVHRDSYGYDGQFYYRLALTPFTSERTALGITLDTPRYRQQRILYPLLARTASLGDPALLAPSMVLVNFLGLCAIAWLGAVYAGQAGRHALAGLAFALYPGFLMTLGRDLTEIVELAFIMGALVLARQERAYAAAGCLGLAVLAKEPALLMGVGAGIAFALSIRSKARRPHWSLCAVPVLTYAGWQAWLQLNWGESVHASFDIPLRAYVGLLIKSADLANHWEVTQLIELAVIAAFAVMVAAAYRRTSAPLLERAAWPLYGLLVAVLGSNVWVEDWAYLRALSEFYVLGVAILIGSRTRAASAMLTVAPLLAPLLAWHVVTMR